ncbi:MAG: CAP domain-containing protein, partial [Thermoflexales bacterium]
MPGGAQAQEDIGALGEAVSVRRDAPAGPELQLAQPSFMGCSVVIVPPTNNDFEQQVVELVNDHRASIGKPPLKRVSLLDQTARYHSCDMRDDDYFRHDTHDRVNGQLVQVCSFSQRVGGHYTNWAAIGENIAAGYVTPADVMQGWLDSTGHRANIEDHLFWEIGVGYCSGGSWWRYWTQNFGRRWNAYPLVIQREYSRTATP